MITLATLYTHHIQLFGNIAAFNHMIYSTTHAYQSVHIGHTLCKTRHPSWSKVLLIQQIFKNIPENDYVFWIDADAMIMNVDKKFVPPDVDFGFTEDENGLNFGCFYLRNTPTTNEMLSRVWNMESCINAKYWEQNAMWLLWPEFKERITFHIHGMDLQSYANSNYKEGSFICHWAARSALDRNREMYRTFKRLHGFAPVYREDKVKENRWIAES